MGLFSKKPKRTPDDDLATDLSRFSVNADDLNRDAATVRTQTPKRGKKFSIDPVDFLNLRADLRFMRARLEAAEEAKAIVESRLAALDATTTALAADRTGADTADLRSKLGDLELQLTSVAADARREPTPSPDAGLVARLDELTAKVDQVGLLPDPSGRLSELEARITEVAEAKAAPMPPPVLVAPGPDPETAERLEVLSRQIGAIDELAGRIAAVEPLAERVAAVDAFAGQLSQLNARVSAQAEFGVQLSSLRDRITELQTQVTEQRALASEAASDDVNDRVNALADRMAATDGLLNQLGQLAERVSANDVAVRQTTDQVSALEERLNSVSTELANQVRELGTDIDGLAAQAAQAEDDGEDASSEAFAESLRESQVKLAKEQARYEIAFREDLASLAEQLRRGVKP